MKAIEVRYISVNLTPEVGANDSLIGVRVVPAGSDGDVIYGRSLSPDENDANEPIPFNPYAGQELHFPVGSIRVSIRDVERHAMTYPDGYAAISNTIWTWLVVGAPPNPALFRFLFATARRLDTAHSLLCQVSAALEDRPQPFTKTRDRLFDALGLAELMCVALGRAVDMLQSIPGQFSLLLTLPQTIANKADSITQIRNAFEHIEDRAAGNVRGKPHPDALSIFNQEDLVLKCVLRYANYSLDLVHEVPQMLVDGRETLFRAAIAAAGSAKTLNVPLVYRAASPGSFERVRERAYFLWENRQGRVWWDANSNWREAEQLESAEYRSRNSKGNS